MSSADNQTPKPGEPSPQDAPTPGTPASGREQNQTPKPRRIAVSSDPTTPIILTGPRRKAASQAATPVPSSDQPAPATPLEAAKEAEYIGSEQTLVGVGTGSVAATPVVSASSDEQWLGDEKTIVPTSKTAAASIDEENYNGSEQTLVGAPAPKFRVLDTTGDEEYLGRDATVISTPQPASSLKDPKGDTTGGLNKKTNPTLDDGWHFKGRQGPLTGKLIGDYEIGGILGQGGMGTVYRARQISLKRRVAVKVLPPNLANDVRLRERFEQEARTASLLNSPNVVQVFAAGTFEDMVYFVMEYVEGTDLSELSRTKEEAGEVFTADECATFVIQAARGLAEAGRHNIVHRDIKPANLMVTSKGLLKIADFGISKITEEHGLTMTGTTVGTPAYCSPEQGRGDQVDVRADIYSLGVVFYELLTGKKPFEGATANALIYQHNYAEPKLPVEIRQGIPEAYQAVVLKCLQKNPAQRYQDAGELVSDLERVRAGSAPMTALMNAFGTGADEAMRRLGIKQRRLWPYLVAALLAVMVVAGGVVVYTHRTAAQQASVVEVSRLRSALAVLDKAQPVPKGSEVRLAALSGLVGKDDKDVQRWQIKFTRILELQKALSVLDHSELPGHALLVSASDDLGRYREDVGSTGEDVHRWQDRLEAATREIASEKAALIELDRSPLVTKAMADRLDPALQRLTVLAGAGDLDVKRWTAGILQGRARISELRARLGVLDDQHAVITEVAMDRCESDLGSLKVLVGGDDQAVQNWANKLREERDNLSRLRKNLARLDAVEWATSTLQAALKADLASYAAVVDANDPDLKKWSRKILDSSNRIVTLRKTLQRLDQNAPLSVDQQAGYQDQLSGYRAMVSLDDGQLQAWTARLRSEQTSISSFQEELKRLNSPERLTIAETDACAAALASLVSLGGISEEQRLLDDRRLQDEHRQLAELRTFLRTHQVGDVVDQQLADDLTMLARIAGEQDEDFKHWRGRVDEYTRLHSALLPLDSAVSIPEQADRLLKEFSAVVPKNSREVKRWSAKLERVAALRLVCAPLDHVGPVSDAMAAAARALVTEVGEKDPEARRFLAKVNRVTYLQGALDAELAGAYVLPTAAAAQSNELISLVSLGDLRAAASATRCAVLAGPGRPVWASDYRRDDYGPFAELTIKGVTQRFRYIPSGSFMMGSPDTEAGRDSDETRVRVTLTHSFWLADSPCTQAFWHAVGLNENSRFKGLERPVERISWDDSKAFCIALSEKIPGLRARLPTEAEWEYACRGGVDAPYPGAQGPIDPDKLDTIAWFKQDTTSTHGVKARFCNRLGLFDMLGNVWQWCEDRYGSYSPSAIIDPIGNEQEIRVARGGSWGDIASKVRSANRLGVRPDMRSLYLGMRIAVAVDWPAGQEPASSVAGVSDIQIIAPRAHVVVQATTHTSTTP